MNREWKFEEPYQMYGRWSAWATTDGGQLHVLAAGSTREEATANLIRQTQEYEADAKTMARKTEEAVRNIVLNAIKGQAGGGYREVRNTTPPLTPGIQSWLQSLGYTVTLEDGTPWWRISW